MKTTLIVLSTLAALFSIVALVMTYTTTRDDSTVWFLVGFVSLLGSVTFFAFYSAEAWRQEYEQAVRPRLFDVAITDSNRVTKSKPHSSMRVLQIVIAILLLIATTSCTSESGRRAKLRNQTKPADTTLIYTSPAGDKMYRVSHHHAYCVMVQNCHGEITLVSQ